MEINNNMPYIYETHLHTATASKCAVSTGDAYIAFYKNLGFSGIFVGKVTDWDLMFFSRGKHAFLAMNFLSTDWTRTGC